MKCVDRDMAVRPESSVEEGSRSPRHPLARFTLPSLAVAGGAYALEVARSRFQQRQVFLPSRYPSGAWDPSVYGLEVEDQWFESADGTPLHAWWIPHARARGTVLYCHGNSGSIADRIAVYRHLRRLRVAILAFDYRGYGRSGGEPSEPGVLADAHAAYDHMTGRLGIVPERLLIFGHSLGGAVAIDVAVERAAAGLVVQSSFTDLRAMARHLYGSLPVRWIARNGFRSLEKVPSITMPKLFVHGTEDGTVPHHMGETLFESAPEPKQWYSVRGAGHNDVHRFGGYRYFRTLTTFARRCFSR